MKTNFFSFIVATFVALLSLVFDNTVQAQGAGCHADCLFSSASSGSLVFNTTTLQAQDTDWTQTPEYQQMYNDLMGTVNKTYEDTYAEYEAIFNQIIANANANAKVMEAQLIAQGQAVYQQALARGMSDAAAQQAAVKTVGNIASTNSITNSFGHDLTMKISNNWPNGSGALYQYSDGSVGNWATRY